MSQSKRKDQGVLFGSLGHKFGHKRENKDLALLRGYYLSIKVLAVLHMSFQESILAESNRRSKTSKSALL